MADISLTDELRGEPPMLSIQVENEAASDALVESLQDGQIRTHANCSDDDEPQEEITDNPPLSRTGNIDTEILDPRGDLIIENGPIRLLVSSSVLFLSCGYFKKMLRENSFVESTDQPCRQIPPTRILHDTDPNAFHLMCKILHFQTVEKPTEVEQLGSLADICDYYESQRVLSFHAATWISEWNFSEVTVHQLRRLLWFAFVFGLSHAFERVSGNLAIALTADGAESLDIHPMPVEIKDDIRRLRSTILTEIHRKIEGNISVIQRDNIKYACIGYKLCNGCGLNKPLEKKKCCSCGSKEFREETCTNSKRLLWFMKWLEFRQHWPFSNHTERSCQSFRDMAHESSLSSPPQNACGHYCEGQSECSLEVAKTALRTGINNILNKASGLKLRKYR